MTRIVVTPHRLREVARLLRQTADTLDTLRDKLSQAYNGLDWEVRGQESVEEHVRQAMVVSVTATGELTFMAHFLEMAAQRFEEADREGASDLEKVWSVYHQSIALYPQRWDVELLGYLKQWGKYFDLPLLPLSFLPSCGTVVGVAALLPSFSRKVESLVKEFWNWLFVRNSQTNLTPPDGSNTPSVQRGKLSEIILKHFEKKSRDRGDKGKGRVIDTIDISPRLASSLPVSIEEARRRLRVDPRMKSMWRQVDAPIKSAPGHRDPDLYRAVIDQFDVEHSHPGRYRPSRTHPDTRCNIFAGDVMRAMGAPLPTKGELYHKRDPMTANARDVYRALMNGWGGWRRIDINNPDDLKRLLEHIKAGKPALAADSGHVAVIRPDHLPEYLTKDNLGDLHIAQAGSHNANDIQLKKAGYGTKFKPDFFIHE